MNVRVVADLQHYRVKRGDIWFERQGEYFFTIKYQLKKDVTHYVRDGEKAKKAHSKLLKKWKALKN